MRSYIFWDMTPCSPLKINQRFEWIFRLHLQGQIISQSRKQQSSACYLLAWLILRRWRWRWHVPPKCRLTFKWLHGVISQKTELFKTLHHHHLAFREFWAHVEPLRPHLFSCPFKIFPGSLTRVLYNLFNFRNPFFALSRHIEHSWFYISKFCHICALFLYTSTAYRRHHLAASLLLIACLS
jgi:hypothetical protein